MARQRFTVVRQVLDHFIARGLKGDPLAVAEKKRILGLFGAEFGNQLIDDCIPDDLLEWITAHPDWQSDWTKGRVARTVQRPFNWCLRRGLITRNPFWGVSFPEGERGRPLTKEEFSSLLGATDEFVKRPLIFLRFSGARPSELCKAQWEMIDFDRAVLVLVKHKSAHSRKDKRPRIIALSAPVVKLLLWIKRHERPSAFVFLNSLGKPWTRNALDMRIWRLRTKLGLPKDAKLYGARHAFATERAKAGTELKELAELLGHTTTRMSEHYIHVAGDVGYLHEALKRKR